MATTATRKPQLHSLRPLRRTVFNRAFAAVYTFALLALFYHHALKLAQSKTLSAISISISMLIADLVLAFMWVTTQSFRMSPVVREAFPENIEKVVPRENFPAMDIFICTADPYKEPPLSVVNTALSVMAYDYPTEKISVYVSDDGGSELTLFAFMEAVKFGRHWLPFCKQNNIMDRCPDAYFRSNYSATSVGIQNIKDMYERMRTRIENVVERGKVSPEDESMMSGEELEAFRPWKQQPFTRHHHPSVIQVLLESGKDKDMAGDPMPNLVYFSREKSKGSPHHFKAGALNALPNTPHAMLCFLMDPSTQPNLGYLQFPQIYHGLNKADIYGSELKHLFQINPVGMNGNRGPNYLGIGCFFNRRAFFGGPSSFVQPEIP